MKMRYLTIASGAAIAVMLSLLVFGPKTGSSASFENAASEWEDQGVIYARFIGPGGRLEIEEWLDTASNATHRIEHDPSGDRLHTVTRDLTISKWNSRDSAYVRRSELSTSGDPWLRNASNLLQIKRMLATGTAEVVGSTNVSGTEVWRVKPSGGVGPDAPTDFDLEVLVSKVSYLPRRFVYHGNGRDVVIEVETQRLSDVAVDVFTAPIEWTVRDVRLSIAGLDRAPFSVWHLGETFGGLTATPPTLEERRAALGGHASLVWFGYGEDGGRSLLEFTQRRADTDRARTELAVYRAQGEVTNQLIRGVSRQVYTLQSQGGRTHFAVLLDGTLVTGSGRMPTDAVLSALAALRPV